MVGGKAIEVTGPVTKAEASLWRDSLRAALAETGPVRLDLSGSGPWDLAGLQLLISLQISYEKSGRDLVLSRAPQVFLDLADRAGLRDRFAEHLEP